MSDTSVRNFSISGILSEILARASDLVEKEIQLAKAELTENITSQLAAGIWIGAALLSGFLTLLLVIEGIILVLIHAGLTPHWAVFLMALGMAIIGGGLYLKGRAAAGRAMPSRTVHNVKRDIKAAKEQLT